MEDICVFVAYCMIGCVDVDLGSTLLLERVGLAVTAESPVSLVSALVSHDRMFARRGSFTQSGCLAKLGVPFAYMLFVDRLEINVIVSKFGTNVLVTILRSCLNKFITFRKTISNRGTCNV